MASRKIPKAILREFLKEQGATKVTAKALEEYRQQVQRYAHALAEACVIVSKHAGRKTLNDQDVKLIDSVSRI